MVRQSHEIVDKSRCSMYLFAPKSQNMRALKLKIKIHLQHYYCERPVQWLPWTQNPLLFK